MGSFLAYTLLSGLYMLGFYLVYRLFLAKDNQHGFNRAVLLGIYFMSFIAIPAIKSFAALQTSAPSEAFVPDALTSVVDGEAAASSVWGSVLLWVFTAGMVAVALRTIAVWIKLTQVIRRGQKKKHGSYTLVVTDEDKYAPFSWMRYVVVSRRDAGENLSAVAVHELKHVEAHHWVDLLVAQIVCIINWYNPAAWLMRDDLMLVHEYQADMAVIESGHDAGQYQMLLIKKAVGARFPSLANSLNHSKLKKRITMMYKEKSGAGRKFKALALVPMLAVVVSVASVPAVQAAVASISSSQISPRKGSENPQKGENSAAKFKVAKLNSDGKSTTVVITGTEMGDNVSISGANISINGTTVEANALNFDLTDGNGIITARFPLAAEADNARRITFVVNGSEHTVNLPAVNSKAMSVKAFTAANDTTVSSNAGNISIAGMKIFVNGKEIDKSDFDKLDAEDITSIKVDKPNNQLQITTK